jgi:hypothetical protein
VYEFVAEVEEGTASNAVDVLNVFGGHVVLCVFVPNFVVSLGQVMECHRNRRLMRKKRSSCIEMTSTSSATLALISSMPMQRRRGRSNDKWRPFLAWFIPFGPRTKQFEHKHLDFWEVVLAVFFFELVIKALPI